MTDRLVTIARYTDYIKANLAKQLLDDYGIKSVVTGQNVGNVYAGIPAIVNIELQTLENDAQKAIEILKSNENLV
jgi:hypothetical protein